jgi:hypothetical protein
MVVLLPNDLSKKLSAFKRAKGRNWAKELEKMLDEAVQLSAWDAEVRKPGPKASQISEKEAIKMAVDAVRTARKK